MRVFSAFHQVDNWDAAAPFTSVPDEGRGAYRYTPALRSLTFARGASARQQTKDPQGPSAAVAGLSVDLAEQEPTHKQGPKGSEDRAPALGVTPSAHLTPKPVQQESPPQKPCGDVAFCDRAAG